jgi:limonene-1,2-epoxide hydrolase
MVTSAAEVVEAFFAAWEAPEVDKLMSFFSDDAVYIDRRGVHRGKAAVRKEIEAQVGAIPDGTSLTVRTALADETSVIIERLESFHLGGRQVNIEGVCVFKLNPEGQISRFRDYHDGASIGQVLE